MIKPYDTVIVKKTGAKAAVVEIDESDKSKPPVYLVEVIDPPTDADILNVVFWCEGDEIEETR